MSERLSGSVKWFNASKGFGFIVQDGSPDDVFVHANDLPAGLDSLQEAQRVTFEAVPGKPGKGQKAINVALA